MGVAIPGTYPGELAAKSIDYKRWFPMIREAGFNCIRIYTLHFPQFYDELKAFNEANPQTPIYIFHGVWLEEEIPNYHEDLFQIEPYLNKEVTDNVSAVHGKINIPERRGKAYGNYTSDISPWLIGYIVGREIHPPEVLKTNSEYPELKAFEGNYLSLNNTNASEVWLLKRLDDLITFEQKTFNTQRPVSISSWPTLDPIAHPLEINRFEDSAVLDFSEVNANKAKAGFFISYHAYPYYPDFIGNDPEYTKFSDYLGQNSYLGYLTDLKSHYKKFPLIIAEYGVPSSWGVAHYASNGMNHGGYDEKEQGEIGVRLLENNQTANCGGGMLFSWIDEWFKRTWVTDPMDFDIERRVLWHNVTSPEQNFGIIGYKKADDSYTEIEKFCSDCPVKSIEGSGDFTYLRLKLNTKKHLGESETLWLSLDTYDKTLGESILPNGKKVTNRAEFVLKITNNVAELYVTEAYDLYGIWHKKASQNQLFRSIATDGAPWKMVRWKNNDPEKEIQYIGSMRVNRLNMPKTTMDAVTLTDTSIEIKLPWTLLNIVDPSRASVMNDDKSTTATEIKESDGINVGIFYNDFEVETTKRYMWEKWNHALDAVEYKKESFEIIKAKLKTITSKPIAVTDFYEVAVNESNKIPIENGVMKNDLSLDGEAIQSVLINTPKNGMIDLHSDGSFTYSPLDGFVGNDTFKYSIKTAYDWSEPVTVQLKVTGIPKSESFIKIYPNPVNRDSVVTIDSKGVIETLEIFNSAGQFLRKTTLNSTLSTVSILGFPNGTYFFVLHAGIEIRTQKVIIKN